MKMPILLAIALSLLAIPGAAPALAAAGTVNGTLVDAEGKAAPNMKVRIRKVVNRAPIGKGVQPQKLADNLAAATPTTDKEGKFSQSLDPGEYWAEAGSKTMGYVKERFEIKSGETTELKLALSKDEK